jgi:hypothetical protein
MKLNLLFTKAELPRAIYAYIFQIAIFEELTYMVELINRQKLLENTYVKSICEYNFILHATVQYDSSNLKLNLFKLSIITLLSSTGASDDS